MHCKKSLVIPAFICFICLLFAQACGTGNGNSILNGASSPIFEQITVNDTAYTEVFRADSLIPSMEFIRLEETPNSMIGSINKLIKHKDVILVLDSRITRNVFIFSLTGKFIGKVIDPMDSTAGPATDMDVRNDTLFVLRDSPAPTIGYYDLTGKNVGSYTFNDLFPANICLTAADVLTYTHFRLNSDGSMFSVMASDMNSPKALNRHIPLSGLMEGTDTNAPVPDNNFFHGNNRLLVHDFGNDTIYPLDPGNGRPTDTSIYIHFAAKGKPDKSADSMYRKDALQYIKELGIATLYDRLWENERYLYFNYLLGEKDVSFLWDKQKKTCVFNSLALVNGAKGVQVPAAWFRSDITSEIVTFYQASYIFSDANSIDRFRQLSSVFEGYRPYDNPVVCLFKIQS